MIITKLSKQSQLYHGSIIIIVWWTYNNDVVILLSLYCLFLIRDGRSCITDHSYQAWTHVCSNHLWSHAARTTVCVFGTMKNFHARFWRFFRRKGCLFPCIQMVPSFIFTFSCYLRIVKSFETIEGCYVSICCILSILWIFRTVYLAHRDIDELKQWAFLQSALLRQWLRWDTWLLWVLSCGFMHPLIQEFNLLGRTWQGCICWLDFSTACVCMICS